MKQESSILISQIVYRGKIVNAKIIKVTAFFKVDSDRFFEQELNRENTILMSRPQVSSVFLNDNSGNPNWQAGSRYQMLVKPLGFINFFGIHQVKVISVNQQNRVLITEERNRICKLWHYTLTLNNSPDKGTERTIEIILYAGILTGIIARLLLYNNKKRNHNWKRYFESRMTV